MHTGCHSGGIAISSSPSLYSKIIWSKTRTYQRTYHQLKNWIFCSQLFIFAFKIKIVMSTHQQYWLEIQWYLKFLFDFWNDWKVLLLSFFKNLCWIHDQIWTKFHIARIRKTKIVWTSCLLKVKIISNEFQTPWIMLNSFCQMEIATAVSSCVWVPKAKEINTSVSKALLDR